MDFLTKKLSRLNYFELIEIIKDFDKDCFNQNLNSIKENISQPIPSRECVNSENRYFLKQYTISKKGEEVLNNKIFLIPSYQGFEFFVILLPLKFLKKEDFYALNFDVRKNCPFNNERKLMLLNLLNRYTKSLPIDIAPERISRLEKTFENETKKKALWGGKHTQGFLNWLEEKKYTRGNKQFRIDIKTRFIGEILEKKLIIKTFLKNKFINFNEVEDFDIFLDKLPFNLEYYKNLANLIDYNQNLNEVVEDEFLIFEEKGIFQKIFQNPKINIDKWYLDLNSLKTEDFTLFESKYLNMVENWNFKLEIKGFLNSITFIIPITVYSSNKDQLTNLASIQFIEILKRNRKGKNKKIGFFQKKFLQKLWQNFIEPIDSPIKEQELVLNYLEIIKLLENKNKIYPEYNKNNIRIEFKGE